MGKKQSEEARLLEETNALLIALLRTLLQINKKLPDNENRIEK